MKYLKSAMHPVRGFATAANNYGATYKQTTRIENSDSQGHGDYESSFIRSANRATQAALEKAGITDYTETYSANSYQQETFMGEEVTAHAEIVDVKHELIYVKHKLTKEVENDGKKRTVNVAQGHVIVETPGGNLSTRSYSEYLPLSNAKEHKNPAYQPDVNAYRPPAAAPTKVIGHEVPLSEDERTIHRDQVGANGKLDLTAMFKRLHTNVYEQAVMEGTGEGFEAKKGKPVMANHSVIMYLPLQEGDQFRAFAYAEPGNRPHQYQWTGTITDMDGNICAIATCNHALLSNEGKPKKADEIDPRFAERLASLKVAKGYENLFENGIHQSHQHFITTKDGYETTATINVSGEPVNVVTADMLKELLEINADARQKRTRLVLQSGRDSGFVLGARVPDFFNKTPEETDAFSKRAQDAFYELAQNPKTLAILNGYVLGGGQELAMSCGIRVATKDLKLGQVETLIGAVAAFDGHQRLTNLVGPVNAARMLISGEMLNAEQASQVGLIDGIISTHSQLYDIKRLWSNEQIKPRQPVPVIGSVDGQLKMLERTTQENYEKQKATIQGLQAQGNTDAINAWHDGVHKARLTTLNVIREQLETKDPQKKSDIERNTFIELTATTESQAATKFWLLDKRQYQKEHTLVQQHGLQKSGVELAAELSRVQGRQ